MHHATSPLRAPPDTATREFALLLGSSVGLFLATSLAWLALTPERSLLRFTNGRVLPTLGVELLLVAVWLPKLRPRWSLDMVSLQWRASDAVYAVLLVLAAKLGSELAYVVSYETVPALAWSVAHYRVVGPISWWVAAPMVLVNPVFEELLYFGYAANVIRQRFGDRAAFFSVVGLRMLVHVYQGPLALVSILPLAILWSLFYLRTNRIWPLVLAHLILNLTSLGGLALRSA